MPERNFEFMFYFDLETSVYSPQFLQLMGEMPHAVRGVRLPGQLRRGGLNAVRTAGPQAGPQLLADASTRMLGDYEYLLYEREPDEVEAFIRRGGWDGINVTIPYKKDGRALPATSCRRGARALGSVNTHRAPRGRHALSATTPTCSALRTCSGAAA